MASTTVTKTKKSKKEKKSKTSEEAPESSVAVTQVATTDDAALELSPPPESPQSSKKRKRDVDPTEEIEVDISAPEPPSKKALRKLKKGKPISTAPAPKQTDPKWDEEFEERQAVEAKQAQAPKRSDHGIWIGNLPFSATKADVRKFLVDNSEIKEDEITRIHMPTPPDPGPLPKGCTKPQNKGFAYVDFSIPSAVDEAIGLSETLLVGRRVLIKNSKSFEGRPDKPKGETDLRNNTKPPSRRVFVGNLGFDTTEEDLREHYKPCGEVENVHVATFEDSGKCKGFAWVEFAEISGGEAAVRGWLKIPEEVEAASDDDEEEEDEDKPKKKPRMRKWWVNRMKGRPLRVEFAEDKAVRYQKRFGKDRKKVHTGSAGDDEPSIEEAEVDTEGVSSEPGSAKPSKAIGDGSVSHRRQRPEKDSRGRSALDVSKLTGGIVAAQGKKTTFD